MPKIAIVINSLKNGGAERTVSNLTTNFPEDYEIDILLNNSSEIDYPYRGNIISLDLKPSKDKLRIGYQCVALFRRLSKLRNIKKHSNYQAVISFSESANIANILTGNKYCKVIVSVRVNLSRSADNKLYKYFGFPLVRKLYNRADKVVAVSKGVECDLIDNFGIHKEKVITIANGCDLDRLQKLADEQISEKEKEILKKENVIISMGRLEHQKGQWHLIRALSVLKQKGISFKLLVFGNGGLECYLKGLVHSLRLDENVIFMGFCENPFRVIKRARAYVLPSLYEGMGNTLIEALACGIPCISTDHDSGAREIFAPDTDVRYKVKGNIEYAKYGILVPALDGIEYNYDDAITDEEMILANAIENILMDSNLEELYRKSSFIRAKEFELSKCINQWIAVILE